MYISNEARLFCMCVRACGCALWGRLFMRVLARRSFTPPDMRVNTHQRVYKLCTHVNKARLASQSIHMRWRIHSVPDVLGSPPPRPVRASVVFRFVRRSQGVGLAATLGPRILIDSARSWIFVSFRLFLNDFHTFFSKNSTWVGNTK